ncbi:MAG: polysulfide reductase NrfD [Gammaproteobacteria bacterium]|jgi:molybdopterin-containing oxidoreductase family membrane subunit|nr:polysulfide reductase NrfD [Gammaproteobacteria bacterium]MBT3490467.1 polysulfide reductase NrfD [Gammaproteobacteria bacterium]MBT3717602.1 polysulfide reductase NrfD [Gammaproteobacteria bacterium]MBT3845795.1 polysulfide reductase NrfD [Gammaproteobacteria bacterium]MBT3893597.1 polysulfide reductase NrfD [Gammaproteobacteria bacterium]
MKRVVYSGIEGRSLGYWGLMGVLGLFILMAAGSFFFMEHSGHHATGMDNQIVWGIPHVFAIFLIVAASGALNVASISSVFNQKIYKPLARMSAILALTLLAGGLAVLVLDLGRADRLVVAMTSYNFKSIFAWNIYLYTGFFVIVLTYLWTMFDPAMHKYTRTAGTAAFLWRLALTTGTGSIFGFLSARQGYDAAVMAPMFIIMSFAFGKAIFMILLIGTYRYTERSMSADLIMRLKNLFGVFVAAVLYFTVVFHITNLYAAEHSGFERFILIEGGIFTMLFWGVQVFLGGIVPLILIYHSAFSHNYRALIVASVLVILGGIAQVYGIVIGGQAYPLVLFPGKEVSSSFNDGVISSYTPSLPEVLLGLGGVALAIALFLFAIKVLRLVPDNLNAEHTENSSDVPC